MSHLSNSILDLTFLATGSHQHVFVKTGQEEHPWVYKIPAAYGRILPYSLYLNRLATASYSHRKRSLLKRIMSPAVSPDQVTLLEKGAGAGPLGPAVTVLKQMHQVGSTIRQRLFALAFAWNARRTFRTMLAMMDHVSQQGIAHALLPYEVMSKGQAVLHVGGASVPYRGPILVQRRSRFLGLADFGSFEWTELIQLQHLLWRNGIALTDKEKLGPSNWALLDGHIRLGDTNSLTRDYRLAYQSLDANVLDERVAVVLERLKGREPIRSLAEEYFGVIRKEISQSKLRELWGVDLEGGKRSAS